jgi:glycerol-3-phosphate O-acyltransferase
LARIISAVEVLRTNLGTMYIDFQDPIHLSEYTAKAQQNTPGLDPFKNKKDQLELNAQLAHTIVFKLQSALRMMPTTMVASIVLLYRKGISKQELRQKVEWLGMILNDRGANFATDNGLPGANTMDLGLEHLSAYLEEKAGIFEPKLVDGDY